MLTLLLNIPANDEKLYYRTVFT